MNRKIISIFILGLALYFSGCAGCNDDEQTTKQDDSECANNEAPFANIRNKLIDDVGVNELVELDGSSSDDIDRCPSGGIVAYRWDLMSVDPTTAVDTTSFALSDNRSITASNVTFIAPPMRAKLEFQLKVFDGDLWSEAATTIVSMRNTRPTANAGPDDIATAGGSYILSGSGSDPDGDSLTYHWEQISGAPVNISDPSDRNAELNLPERNGSLIVLLLTVNDGYIDSLPSEKAKISIQVFRRDKDHTIFVNSTNGNDETSTGDRGSPFKTLKRAIHKISGIGSIPIEGPVDIIMAEGNYREPITVVPPGTSILGGFASNDWDRDPKTFHTVLIADSSQACAGDSERMPFMVFAGAGYEETLIDGLEIIGSDSCLNNFGFFKFYTLWIYNGAAPTIMNNMIYASGFGIARPAYSESTGVAVGRHEDTFLSTPLIANNAIYGGHGYYKTKGLYIVGEAKPRIYHNTIHTGQCWQLSACGDPGCSVIGRSYGFHIDGADAEIINNIVYLGYGRFPSNIYRIGVVYNDQSGEAFNLTYLRNNVFFVPYNVKPNLTPLYSHNFTDDNFSAMTHLYTIQQVNALNKSGRTNDNKNVDPFLNGLSPDDPTYPDFHIPATSPIQGFAYDLSDEVPYDYDGDLRDPNTDMEPGLDEIIELIDVEP